MDRNDQPGTNEGARPEETVAAMDQIEKRIRDMYSDPGIVDAFSGGNYVLYGDAIAHSLKQLIAENPNKESLRVIDIGCGGGGGYAIVDEVVRGYSKARSLTRLTGSWTGIELSPAMITEADRNITTARTKGHDPIDYHLINSNFRTLSPELREEVGRGDLVVAFGAGDGIVDYWQHINDLLQYVDDGGRILAIDYLTAGKVTPLTDAQAAERIGWQALGDSELSKITVAAGDFGLSRLNMALKVLRNIPALNAFSHLMKSESGFPEYAERMNTLTRESALSFAESTGAKIAIPSGPLSFVPAFVEVKITPKLRELVRDHLNMEG